MVGATTFSRVIYPAQSSSRRIDSDGRPTRPMRAVVSISTAKPLTDFNLVTTFAAGVLTSKGTAGRGQSFPLLALWP